MDATNDNGNFFLDKESCQTVSLARGIAGILVIITSLVSLIIILVLRIFKKYSQRLFLYLTIATLLHAPIYVMEAFSVKCRSDYKKPEALYPLCSITGTLDMYTSWLQNIVVLWIILYLFRMIVIRKLINTLKLEILVIVFALIIPLPSALIPLIRKKFGVNGAWCWIMTKKNSEDYDYEGLGYEIAFWYFPFFIETLVIIITVISMIVVSAKKSFSKAKYQLYASEYKQQLKESLPLLIFPVVYCILNVFEMIIDAMSNLDSKAHENSLFQLWMIDAILNPSKAILVIVGYLVCIAWVKHKEWRHNRQGASSDEQNELTTDSSRATYGSLSEHLISDEM